MAKSKKKGGASTPFLPKDTIVVVLNLDERVDRLAEVASELSRAGIVDWERFAAIKDDPGWRGYNKSIFEIFTKYANYENILLFEDDCLFEPDITHLSKVFKQLPDEWDGLWLGSNLQDIHSDQITDNLFRLYDGWNTHAVLFSKKFRDWILERWGPDDLVFDEWFRVNALRKKKCYVAYPMIAVQRPSKSDITGNFEDYGQAWASARSRFAPKRAVPTGSKKVKE